MTQHLNIPVLREAFTNVRVGDRIRFAEEKLSYTVQAKDDRFYVCSKPFAPKKTVIYCIIDLQTGIRGPDNNIFCAGYETREDCQERLRELQRGALDISKRNCIFCKVTRIGFMQGRKRPKWARVRA